MTRNKILSAMAEARRFLERCDALLQDEDWSGGTKESGAVRRSSLDLTRALAEMRRA